MNMPRMTEKQKIIMGIILKKTGEGKFLNIRELHALLPYKCSYGAVRISIRFLIKNNVLVRKKSGGSSLLVPTDLSYRLFSTKITGDLIYPFGSLYINI